MNQLLGKVSLGTALLGAILSSRGDASAQAPAQKQEGKTAAGSQENAAEPPNAAQIELLETKYRFEAKGDSHKEVHALVKINSELGVRQFAWLNFDYNRGFQSVEIPLVRITHERGGTADILPGAISDVPNPAVEKFPAYQQVRIKSVRVLGLQPGDSLEYRVLTTTTNPPLAPDFWIEHSFDRTGVVTHEIFEIDVPRKLAEEATNGNTILRSTYMGNPAVFAPTEGADRQIYRWDRNNPGKETKDPPEGGTEPDVLFSTLRDWNSLSSRLARLWIEPKETGIRELKSRGLLPAPGEASAVMRAGYAYVSRKLRTVDLPLGAAGFQIRSLKEILDSGYATQEEKCGVLALFEAAAGVQPAILLIGPSGDLRRQIARPTIFSHALVLVEEEKRAFALDPSLEVAPYGLVPSQYRGKAAFRVPPGQTDGYTDDPWNARVPEETPLRAKQSVVISARLDAEGALNARVRYSLRGDNELLLRVTFHQTPQDKQKEIAQYLALSDGFRGKATSVKTSDPYATDGPFDVEYELTQEKFVDWTKKPVRIPALLPLPGLPEARNKPVTDRKIELGPPLEIELSGTLRLPPGVTAAAPPGTSVKRDYATFTSQYSATGNLVHFSRHLNFLLPEIPSARAVDLTAFLHAVQSDQSQLFVLEKPETAVPDKPQ